MKRVRGFITRRALIVGLIAGGGILAASSLATKVGGFDGTAGGKVWHGQKLHAQGEDRRAERMAELKEKLMLGPEQEFAWQAFISAAQPEMRRTHVRRQSMQDEFDSLNMPQRLDRMLALSEAHRARLLERTHVIKAFYGQLSPEQQSVFDAEARLDRQRDQQSRRFQA